jgi:hypothetical protein
MIGYNGLIIVAFNEDVLPGFSYTASCNLTGWLIYMMYPTIGFPFRWSVSAIVFSFSDLSF